MLLACRLAGLSALEASSLADPGLRVNLSKSARAYRSAIAALGTLSARALGAWSAGDWPLNALNNIALRLEIVGEQEREVRVVLRAGARGRNTTLSRPRTSGSASIVRARLLTNLMMILARRYAGAAFPAKKNTRGVTGSFGLRLHRRHDHEHSSCRRHPARTDRADRGPSGGPARS
jgi:hypothetical protein